MEEKRLHSYLGPYDANTIVQLASHSPEEFMLATKRIASQGFKEINLNSGCPSDRVQSGLLGAVRIGQPPRLSSPFF
jgi:tRNA-dihydrouridine synthase A